MNPALTLDLNTFALQFARLLRVHLALCEDAMTLTARENQALSGSTGYHPLEFCEIRKGLLPRLEASLMELRRWRQSWQQMTPAERAGCCEVKSLLQAAQNLLMKVLLLDRENQQALLRRGLLPAQHLPASVPQPHYAADIYRRHARR